MPTGIVKWFNVTKGFGFITAQDANSGIKDYFVHYSAIEGDGFKSLQMGEEVEFETTKTEKGWMARSVKRIA